MQLIRVLIYIVFNPEHMYPPMEGLMEGLLQPVVIVFAILLILHFLLWYLLQFIQQHPHDCWHFDNHLIAIILSIIIVTLFLGIVFSLVHYDREWHQRDSLRGWHYTPESDKREWHYRVTLECDTREWDQRVTPESGHVTIFCNFCHHLHWLMLLAGPLLFHLLIVHHIIGSVNGAQHLKYPANAVLTKFLPKISDTVFDWNFDIPLVIKWYSPHFPVFPLSSFPPQHHVWPLTVCSSSWNIDKCRTSRVAPSQSSAAAQCHHDYLLKQRHVAQTATMMASAKSAKETARARITGQVCSLRKKTVTSLDVIIITRLHYLQNRATIL